MERIPTPSELAAQWISEQVAYDKRKENPPAIQAVIELAVRDPHRLWPFILE